MTSRSSVRRPALLVAALAASLAAASPASADPGHDSRVRAGDPPVRVSENFPLRPAGSQLHHGRDAIGMAVNPRNRRHVVAVYADWASLWCETAVSFDGGRTWRRDRLEAPAGFIQPPCTVGGHLSSQLGSTIEFGAGDNVYTTFASARTNAQGFEEGRSILVAKSTDGGRTFGKGVVALAGGADADAGPDYKIPKLVVDPGKGRFRDNVHLVAAGDRQGADGVAEDDIVFTKSTDGGRTWTSGKVLDGQGSAIEPSRPVIGRFGHLYVAWRTRQPGNKPGTYSTRGTVVVARSTNEGRTWRLRGAAGVRGYEYQGPKEVPFATVQNYTNSTFPRLAADKRSGAVYLVYNNGDRPTQAGEFRAADHFIHPDADVWFQRSLDGGDDWSTPTKLNDPIALTVGITQTRQPEVAVAPNGRVDVVWNDRRHWYRGCVHTHNPCLETRLGDTYYTWSSDRGRSFATDRRLTDRSMSLDVGYDYRFGTYWEYSPAIAHLGSRRLLVGWMDTRDGNFETDTQSIYLARVDHSPSNRMPVRRIGGDDPVDLSVALSRRAYPGGPEAVLGGTFATRAWTRVVIVDEDDPASVMAAGVLARAFIAPVLLSSKEGLSRDVVDEVARLAPVGAFVIGSTRALSEEVVTDLANTGIPREEIQRIAGTSRADTARRIAEAYDRRSVRGREQGHAAFDGAILVNPASDEAYAASVLAATRRLPILFAGRTSLPQATREALEQFAIPKVLVVGGREAISPAALTGLKAPQRLSGRTAITTARAVVAESRRRALADNQVFTATKRIDAALMGAAAAHLGGVQLSGSPSQAAAAVRGMELDGRVDRIFHVRSGAEG